MNRAKPVRSAVKNAIKSAVAIFTAKVVVAFSDTVNATLSSESSGGAVSDGLAKDFGQTGGVWHDKMLGDSGYTIAQIVATSESFELRVRGTAPINLIESVSFIGLEGEAFNLSDVDSVGGQGVVEDDNTLWSWTYTGRGDKQGMPSVDTTGTYVFTINYRG